MSGLLVDLLRARCGECRVKPAIAAATIVFFLHAANLGEDALSMIERDPPAAITLDLILPGVDGWEVLKRLKERPTTRGIPVVIVSVVDDQGRVVGQHRHDDIAAVGELAGRGGYPGPDLLRQLFGLAGASVPQGQLVARLVFHLFLG